VIAFPWTKNQQINMNVHVCKILTSPVVLCGSETVSFFEGRTQIKNIYTYE
jgi:tmRNA-binding protein